MGHSGQHVPEAAIIEVTRSEQEAPGTLGWLIDKMFCPHTWMKDEKYEEKKNEFWNVTNLEHTDKKFWWFRLYLTSR